MAFLTKRVETSDYHRRLVVEALESINKRNVTLKEQVEELNSQICDLVDEDEAARKEGESTSSEAEKIYIANFHLKEAYHSLVLTGGGMPTRRWWSESRPISQLLTPLN